MKTQTSFDPMTTRYEFDCGECSDWAQIDTTQDAPYYGTWASAIELKILTYCEGDITRTQCDTEAEFAEELLSLINWAKDGGFWKGIDPGWTPNRSAKAFKMLGFGEYLH